MAPLLAVAVLVCTSAAGPQNQTPPQFRTRVVLVPLEVRVVDANGNPVTDLTPADFAVYENDVPQAVAHFQKVSFTAPSPKGPSDHADPTLAALATTRRTFVIVLGRGRLNEPAKALDALIAFVRARTLPGDRVGVIAYLRATELTTEHEAIGRLLERHRERHETIESRIARDFRMKTFPPIRVAPDTRASIDALFEAPGLPAVRDLPGARGDNLSRYIDPYCLRLALDYLRLVDGEKHLIFLSQHRYGLGGISADPGHHYLVKIATSARIALTLIHTGGIEGLDLYRGQLVVLPRSTRGRDDSGCSTPSRFA